MAKYPGLVRVSHEQLNEVFTKMNKWFQNSPTQFRKTSNGLSWSTLSFFEVIVVRCDKAISSHEARQDVKFLALPT